MTRILSKSHRIWNVCRTIEKIGTIFFSFSISKNVCRIINLVIIIYEFIVIAILI